jgi:PIN domain nuclease of toxin-antitoxin system
VIAGLLDTHPLLWALADDARLPPWLRKDIEADASSFGVSDASLWEIAIKCSTGKLRVCCRSTSRRAVVTDAAACALSRQAAPAGRPGLRS